MHIELQSSKLDIKKQKNFFNIMYNKEKYHSCMSFSFSNTHR